MCQSADSQKLKAEANQKKHIQERKGERRQKDDQIESKKEHWTWKPTSLFCDHSERFDFLDSGFNNIMLSLPVFQMPW